MKGFILIISLICSASGSRINIEPSDTAESKIQIINDFIPKTQEKIYDISNSIRVFLFQLLSEYPLQKLLTLDEKDPLFQFENITLELPFQEINGSILLREGQIEGLSTLVDDLKTNISIFQKITLNYDLIISNLSFNGIYNADLNLNLNNISGAPLKGSALGNGIYYVNLTDIFLKLSLVVSPKTLTKVDVTDVDLDFGFGNLNLFFENSTLNGRVLEKIFWEETSNNITSTFPDIWSDVESPLEEFLTELFNYVVQDCSYLQLVKIIQKPGDLSASCMNLPIIPTTTTTKPTTVKSNGGIGNMMMMYNNVITGAVLIYLAHQVHNQII